MSQSMNLFSAQATTVRISLTTTTSTPVLLPFAGNTIRILQEGPNACYLAIAPTSGLAVAVVPSSTPSRFATPVLSGTDSTMSIDATAPQWIAGICGTGTAVVEIQVGEGI